MKQVHGRRRLGLLVAGLAFVGAFAACGSGDDDAATDTQAPDQVGGTDEGAPVLPVEFTNADGSSTTVTDVSRIVPLNGDIAEVVFALGLGDNVVATDVSATYPAEAAALPKVGYQRTLSVEGILAQNPTVVIGNTSAGPPDVIEQLKAVVPVVIVDYPVDLSGPAAKIEAVATALGVPDHGMALADDVDQAIETAQAEVPADANAPRVVLLYLRGTQVQMIGGADIGVSAVLEAAGVVDAAAEAGITQTSPITPEALVEAAPDVIITTTTGLESVGGIDGLLNIPGVAQTPAGQNRKVLDFDDQYLLGGGPRSGDALSDLIAALYD
ncbi:MAG TPA: ABC transporter substrate-binding protein [Acidimicrobiales bacterium]|jgi:iron complex transport system substrate-binding protein